MTLSPPTAPLSPAPPAPLSTRGLAVLLIAYMPVNVTFGSLNVLADALGADLGTDDAGQQLVLAAYTTTFAATLVIAGRLGDRWGRRRLLAIGALATVVLSVAAALAPDLASTVVLRAALGIAAGLLTPQVLATIQSTATGSRRTQGLMVFAAMAGVSTVLGQVLAGVVATALPEHLGWRAVQVLIGAIALVGVLGLPAVPRSRSSTPPAMDALGASVLGASLLLLVVPLTLGRSAGWPPWSVLGLAAGGALLVVFWTLQRRAERAGITPVVPPSLLRITVVRRGLLMALLFFTTYGAFLYELSSLAQARYGMGALGPALLVLGFGITFVATSVALPRLLPGAGPRTMTRAALAQAAILLLIAALAGTGHDDLLSLQWALVPLGVAQACMYGPVLQTVISRAPHGAAGVASGLFTTCQQLGLALGVALLGGVFWSLAGSEGEAARLDRSLMVVFCVHALCALVFAVLARSLAAPRPEGAAA
ncbi:MFS transporter [Brachybacterium sp. YJGR34]|uniref:MFS transporter n=1 Tax=Brachybacterium sp. YJGR34 TaxID=2059911 RepID=UPI000E0BC632|nr:MFS transporter [Brachybacterium sp. YJGR34]